MKKLKVITNVILCVLLVLAASSLFFGKENPFALETNEYAVKENFKDIAITTDTADIQLVLSEGTESRIVCEEAKSEIHSVTVAENTLQIEVDDTKKWYENIGIGLRTPKITVYFGENEYGNISLKTDAGNILLENIVAAGKLETEADTGNVKFAVCDAGEVFINTDTGNVSLENVIITDKLAIEVETGDVKFEACDAGEIFIKTDTGNVWLNQSIAAGKLAIEVETGDVKFKACDAGEVFIETDTGNVTGSFLTDKVIFAESNTGRIDIPKVIAEEKCEIITDTGNIKITTMQGRS